MKEPASLQMLEDSKYPQSAVPDVSEEAHEPQEMMRANDEKLGKFFKERKMPIQQPDAISNKSLRLI